ncbi:MAG: CRISPR-associated endonuclease Cas3'', partial [Actinobacteria bacterium]|nr:CRISPR-associated endonuclease Cas3'' [Actinomycetota bacterium]
ASLDALQQRFGRVDRAGVVSAAGEPATSVVLGASTAVGTGAEDPVYGSALAATWEWLQSVVSNGKVDFGSGRLPVPEGASRQALLPPQPWCPQLLPSHLDRWVQTSTEPHADPVVAHWLHGLEERPVDVSVIWRADVTGDMLWSIVADRMADNEPGSTPGEGLIAGLFEACPPDARESLGLPARAVRQWLVARRTGEAPAASDDVMDVVAQADGAGDDRPVDRMAPVVLIGTVSGSGEMEIIDRPARIKPGTTIVVPLSYGGIHSGSWDPTEMAPVTDRATAARALADRRAVLRLFTGGVTLPSTIDAAGGNGHLAFPVPPVQDDEADPIALAVAEEEAVTTWLDAYLDAARHELATITGESDPSALEMAVVRHLSLGRRRVRRMTRPGLDDGALTCFVVSTGRRLPVRLLREGGAEQSGATVDSEPETSSFVGREVTLAVHLSDVSHWGEVLATNVGLPADVVADVALAGSFHDLGKADPRFQLMLRQGMIGAGSDLLAKSALAPGDRAARRAAQRASGYPRGGRHELLSVALVEGCDELMAQSHDRDLVLHLVASHHGHCRPFAPVVLDEGPLEITVEHAGERLRATSEHGLARLDAGVPERFWLLVRRYGWWGLAWLEALLRLADHRASEFEQLHGDGEGEEGR